MECAKVAANPYVSVYQTLDEAVFSPTVPVGTRGALYDAIDNLVKLHAPAEHVALAGHISVALHRLEQARRAADLAQEERAREELQTMGAEWLQIPMRAAH